MVDDYKRLKPGLDLLRSPDTRAARIDSRPLQRNPPQRRHWWTIATLAEELHMRGEHVIVEARFQRSGRADIFLPEILMIIEVLNSETEDMLAEKCTRHYTDTALRVAWITTKEAETLEPAQAVELAFSRAKTVRA